MYIMNTHCVGTLKFKINAMEIRDVVKLYYCKLSNV